MRYVNPFDKEKKIEETGYRLRGLEISERQEILNEETSFSSFIQIRR